MARQGSTDVGLGVDEVNSLGHLKSCQNVTIIWLGAGAFPGTGWPAGCVTIVTGQAGKDLWLQRVNSWYDQHPQFKQFKHADNVFWNFCPNYVCS